MKEIARYSGVIVMLVGVLFLAILFFGGTTNNVNLLIGLLLVIEGFLGHIFVNNMRKGSVVSNLIWAVVLLFLPYFIFFFMKKLAYDSEEFALYN